MHFPFSSLVRVPTVPQSRRKSGSTCDVLNVLFNHSYPCMTSLEFLYSSSPNVQTSFILPLLQRYRRKIIMVKLAFLRNFKL